MQTGLHQDMEFNKERMMNPSMCQPFATDALNRREQQVSEYLQERAMHNERDVIAPSRRSRLVAWFAFRPHHGIARPAAEPTS